VRALTLLVTLLALTGCGARRHAGATVAYDLSYRRALAGDAAVGGVASGGLRARVFAGPKVPSPAFGFDVNLGLSHPSGFAWRLAAYPVGSALRLGEHGIAGVVAGAGLSGVTSRVPAALELPAELFATIRLGGRAAVSVWLQPAWLPFSSTRDDGAPDVAFIDELRTGVTFRAGTSHHRWSFFSGGGYHLGVVYTEEVGARMLGVTIGYDADVATE
jgi:hypothetical protein